MQNEGLDYSIVLEEAKRLGFIEADPSADVDGYDARSKLIILSRLCYGVYII